MNKKLIIIISVLIAISVFLFYKYNNIENNSIKAEINNKTYSLNQIQKQYGKDFIKEINSSSVIVYNGETNYTCDYYRPCTIWPNSQGGTITWSAPLVTITFKK